MAADLRNKTVGQIVAENPHMRPVFERLRIDYCCGGDKKLDKAAAEKNLDLDQVVSELQNAKPKRDEKSERDWSKESLSEMADHIESSHHVYMKKNLPRLDELLTKIERAHAENHGEMLAELHQIFSGLKNEIEMHLFKEETILFPYVKQIENYAEGRVEEVEFHCGSVSNPIRQMEHEHENAGEALARMRELTDDYTLPDDACPSFKATYEGLQEMEDDLHQHIHLENNILFPRAEELERKAGIADADQATSTPCSRK